MTPEQFVRTWQQNTNTERAASQSQFIELCQLFEHPTPSSDPTGENFAFEKGAQKRGGKSGRGWADVWKRNFFAWEYKGIHANLDKAYEQLLRYHGSLDNPPLLVVSDMKQFIIHTNWTNTPTQEHRVTLEGLLDDTERRRLRAVFWNPDELKPKREIREITEEAANKLGEVAAMMEARGLEPLRVARFLDRVVFTLFAEDADLLPREPFTAICNNSGLVPARFSPPLRQLWDAMAHGGYFGSDDIAHFNGGLFSEVEVLELQSQEIQIIRGAAGMNWRNVDASIFGTLFERALDPSKRAQLGAHYTSRADIESLLEPVLLRPLREEWEVLRPQLEAAVAESTPSEELETALNTFGSKLAGTQVLDPSCGSGNFLYIALQKLKDLELQVRNWADVAGVSATFGSVTPANFHGIETNVFAHDLATTTLQIGWLQWGRRNGQPTPPEPILQAKVDIQQRDAILDLSDPAHPREAQWPTCDVIVGNPPFLGGSRLWSELGRDYQTALYQTYAGRVPGFADLCCYWFEKARAQIHAGAAKRAGLLATQAIRGGVSRDVLKRIKETGDIFFAISDRDWTLDGAAVHVSLVGFDGSKDHALHELDGREVASINTNLTAGADITQAKQLPENVGICYIGTKKAGDFNLPEADAIMLLGAPNPNGKPNSDVLKPWANGSSIVQRPDPQWIVDAGVMPLADFEFYERPFFRVEAYVKPERMKNNEERARRLWWQHRRPAVEMREAIRPLSRYIATSGISKYRIFVWLPTQVLPDNALFVFSRDDDYYFGVLHSRVHQLWALKMGTQLEDRPRYTPETCFLTFPFPIPTPAQEQAIAEAARDLNEKRENWLNPPQWMKRETLTFAARVDGVWGRWVQDADESGLGVAHWSRWVMRDPNLTVTASRLDNTVKPPVWRPTTERLRDALPRRTLTNLYNERPAWLDGLHRALDHAVLDAYGWPHDLDDEALLERLLALNLQRAE